MKLPFFLLPELFADREAWRIVINGWCFIGICCLERNTRNMVIAKAKAPSLAAVWAKQV